MDNHQESEPPAQPPASESEPPPESDVENVEGEALTEPASEPTPAERPKLRPVGESERILALDVVRGVAIFGIFAVNIQDFNMPFGIRLEDSSLATQPWSEQLVCGIIKVFFQRKFITLFSIMFGMGLAVGFERARAAGRPFAFLYLRRLTVLAMFGLVHALLIWYGDVLFTYALFGIFLLLARKFAPGLLLALAIVLTLVSLSLLLVNPDLRLLRELEPGIMEHVREFESDRIDPARFPLHALDVIERTYWNPADPRWIGAEIRAYRDGPFIEAFTFRAVSFFFILMFVVFSAGWGLLGLFFLGAALLKFKFFDPSRKGWYPRFAFWGIFLGLPVEIYIVWQGYESGYAYDDYFVFKEMAHEVAAIALALGYLGLISWIVSSGILKPVQRAIASVGRMALTNYIGQSVVATGITYWWGLGLFNTYTHVEQLAIVCIIYVIQIELSILWLTFFRIGPLEWIWRTLTYLRFQPLVRRSAD